MSPTDEMRATAAILGKTAEAFLRMADAQDRGDMVAFVELAADAIKFSIAMTKMTASDGGFDLTMREAWLAFGKSSGWIEDSEAEAEPAPDQSISLEEIERLRSKAS